MVQVMNWYFDTELCTQLRLPLTKVLCMLTSPSVRRQLVETTVPGEGAAVTFLGLYLFE